MKILIIILFLSFVDITLTFKTLSMYRTLQPNDDKWYENELSFFPQILIKTFGIGLKSLVISISFTFSVFLMLSYLIIRFGMTELFYVIIGMLILVINLHVHNLDFLKERIKSRWDIPI